MRKLFPGYYRPTARECEEQFKSCLFSFDTNILFNLYRYTPVSRDSFLNVVMNIKDRIWLPYQVASEYHRKRIAVIIGEQKLYEAVKHTVDEAIELLNKKHRRPSGRFIATSLIEPICKALEQAKTDLDKRKAEHPDLLKGDPILVTLTELFDDSKVGEPFNPEEQKKRLAIADARFKEKIPPGYLDSTGAKKKEGDRKYGDAVLWFQLMEHAKKNKRSVVFVTDESGEDWWELGNDDQTIGPRCELVQEMNKEAGVWFHMYSADRFLQCCNDYLKADVKAEVIKEVKEVQEAQKKGALEGSDALGFAFRPIIQEINRQHKITAELAKIFNPIAEEAKRREKMTAEIAKMLAPLADESTQSKLKLINDLFKGYYF